MNFDETFERLLNAWNRHQDLRTGGASIASLAESRRALDALRTDIRRLI